ncbi:MAG TPA: hypothetical protein VGB03_00080, partial [Acidimicrobiales bacterium]
MSTTVTAPDGTRWRVGRRWTPWEPRLYKPVDLPDPGLLDAVGCIDELPVLAVVVVAILAVVVVFFFVVPLLITLADLLVLAVLVVLGVLVRVVLRRPWIVDAVRADRTERLSWKVVGWHRSG